MRRELLMLAKKYDSAKNNVAGWWSSTKLDGTRAFWDGGLSRGLPTVEVPWANIFHPKTGKLKAKIKPVSTGLWSRYGNPIIAPDWFLNRLPSCLLDGELWAGRGNFQKCRSIVAGDVPGPNWDKIEFAVFGSPPPSIMFSDGLVKNPQFVREIAPDGWVDSRKESGVCEDFQFAGLNGFDDELTFLRDAIPVDGSVFLHKQSKLSADPTEAREQVEKALEDALSLGDEGIVLRDPQQQWAPKRVKGLLKYKPFSDDEGRLIGYTAGRGKLSGLIGALILDYEGNRLELSGMTNEEREFSDDAHGAYATLHQGSDMPDWAQGKHFKRSDTISFKFRELSDGNIPKEARLWRKR